MGRPSRKGNDKSEESSDGAGTKRKASEDEGSAKKVKTEQGDDKGLKNSTESNHSDTDYDASRNNENGKGFNLKIASWNVGGIRSAIKVRSNNFNF